MNHYDAIAFTDITGNEALSALVQHILPHTQTVGACAV
ncbi:Uncharacterised protein [Kingella potus]|uniref:Uncharacterized protein n=1 Tax=Kingella potus TaxID=265175 RepID=A0A377R1I0_9NEIS|nr:Uncharacterised protein [Kingella potus]